MNEKTSRERLAAEPEGHEAACARAPELISYLYHEAAPAEALEFEAHMERCASCRSELAEFAGVRRAIGDWHAEALGRIALSVSQANGFAQGFVAKEAKAERGPKRRNALDALREFFTLSPAWMRAATAFAGLALCALAVIAVTHLFERAQQPRTATAEVAPDKVYTQRQADEMLAQSGSGNGTGEPQQDEASKARQTPARLTQTPAPAATQPRSYASAYARRGVRSSAAAPSYMMARNAPARHGSNPMSSRERQQLAEVLLPQENSTEESLPRLSDLLGNDSN